MEKTQIRTILLYHFKEGLSGTESWRKVNDTLGPDVVSIRTVQRWFKKFRTMNEDVKDKPRSGQPTKIDIDALRELIEEDPRSTVRMLAGTLNVSLGTVSNYLKKIGMKKKLDKWVPHNLTDDQKARRSLLCQQMLDEHKKCSFLDRIITCDEKWITYDNRRRSSSWQLKGQRPLHFAKPEFHQKKVMVTVWWTTRGVIHHSFLEPGKTITAKAYCDEIEAMYEKIPGYIKRAGPILLHDNARPHVAKMTQEKLAFLQIEVLPHPAYSPDLAPSDYYLFRSLANFLRGKKYVRREHAQNDFVDFIESRSQGFFKKGIYDLVGRWQQCVDSYGCYFN